MPKMVITHSVVDIDRWLKGKEERAAALGSARGNVTDHVAMDGSNTVAVTLEVHDLAALNAMLTSPPPEVLAQMESHGVIPPLTVFVREVAARLLLTRNVNSPTSCLSGSSSRSTRTS